MKLKHDVIMAGLSVNMQPALIAAESIWKELGREEGVTVTCALDGEHFAGSLHYYGFALDFRINYFTGDQKLAALEALRAKLPEPFDVILENTHIHVEYDIFKESNHD